MRRPYLGLAALVMLAAALLPPMHELSHESFAWHMVQHLALIFGVAPLLAFALPRPRSGSPVRALANPVVVVILHAVALWAWHLPVLYDKALEIAPLHAIEHGSFLVTAFLFWCVVAARWQPVHQLKRAAVVFVTGLQSAALGAILVFASEPLYEAHLATSGSHGLTPLEDQQLAGGIMWIPPGVVYLVLTLALFLSWMNNAAPEDGVATEAGSAR